MKEKKVWTLELIEDLEKVPEQYLKHFTNTDGLYEIRVKSGTDIFRIFCFFDADKLVILMNGLQKKSQKAPKSQIEQAIKIESEYERQKK